MAIIGGNWIAGNPPRNFAHPVAPRPLTLAAPVDNGIHGNFEQNSQIGEYAPEKVSIEVAGEDLLAIIADLRARIVALETA